MTQQPLLAPRRLTAVAFIFVLVVDLLACLVLAGQIGAVAHLPFANDEAVHANGGLELALDLKAGDVPGFFAHTYGQAYYPPAQSWLLAPAFVLFGATETVARLVSLACLFFSVLLLFAIGLELHERYGWLAGLLAALFPFTSQQSLTISAMTMQEPAGLLFTLIALWLYIRGVKRLQNGHTDTDAVVEIGAQSARRGSVTPDSEPPGRRPGGSNNSPTVLDTQRTQSSLGRSKNALRGLPNPRLRPGFGNPGRAELDRSDFEAERAPTPAKPAAWEPPLLATSYRYLVLASLALVAVTLSKYLFGVYLGTTFVAARAIEARFRPTRFLSRANLALFGPAAILLALWFLDTSKLSDFWRYANVPSLQADQFGLEQYTFYWRSIVVHYTAALPLGLLLLAGFVYGLARWRNPILIVLALHILVAIAGMTLRRTINPRFVYVAAPLIYLLGGVLVARSVDALRGSGAGWLRAAAGIAAIAVLAASLPGIRDRYMSYPAMLQVQIKTDPRAFEAYAWIAQNVPADRRDILLLNYWDAFSGEGLKWYLLSRDAAPGRRFAEVSVAPRYAWPVNVETLADFQRTLDELGVNTLIGFAGGPEGNGRVWLESQSAIGEGLDFVGQAEFDMAQWDRTLLLQLRDNAFSQANALAEAMQRYSYPYHVTATIYWK